MQIYQAIIGKEWVLCRCCNHKLGRIIGKPSGIEIKCGSCKSINVVGSQDDKGSENDADK